jgi:hypothetical protein
MVFFLSHRQRQFSLSILEFANPFSLIRKKKTEKRKRKMKFGIKIEFLKIEGTGYQIAKKDRELK